MGALMPEEACGVILDARLRLWRRQAEVAKDRGLEEVRIMSSEGSVVVGTAKADMFISFMETMGLPLLAPVSWAMPKENVEGPLDGGPEVPMVPSAYDNTAPNAGGDDDGP